MIGDIVQGNYLANMRQRDLNAARSNFSVLPRTAKAAILTAGLVAAGIVYNLYDSRISANNVPERELTRQSSFDGYSVRK
ncbi:MAG: hypothetical protein AABW88_05010 [Nanoarchaeota archaeon]